jgi:thiol:disulfide interchange protein DsbG
MIRPVTYPLSMLAIALFLLIASSQAQSADRPASVQALEGQGLTVVQEFAVGGGMRGFAGVADGHPIAIYVTADGKAIVGTRLDEKGAPLDEATLQNLVAKPMAQQAWTQLESATWVLDGKAQAPRIVYTFSDPNCPYCHRFWEAARPWVDSGKVQLRHVLVGIIREDSPAKVAAILTASDRSAALLENERNHAQGGIAPAQEVPGKVREILEANQRLMLAQGFRGTPGIVYLDADGTLQKINGMPQGEALSKMMGPR